MHWNERGNFVWASCSARGKVCDRREELSAREGRAERGMRLLRARGLADLGQVASGSARQGFWLGNGKVGP